MAGFEQAGLPGSDFIRNALNEESPDIQDIVNTIENFQQENGILLPSLQPALPFLDLHDVRRLDFNQFVMENLREKLLEQVKQLSDDKLRQLLEHALPFIHVPEVRPVIMAVLKHLPKVPEDCIEQIASDSTLYEECEIEVKRQIWIKHHPLFGDAVGPLLNEYIENKYSSLFSLEQINSHSFFSVPSKSRRQRPVIKGLAKMIGKSLELYNLVLQFLRTLFLRTKEVHYCTLRSELLMAVHDAEIKDIKDVDPCHKFTWCLDACIRDNMIEGKRIKELKGFLETAKRGEEKVLGDIAMILCDPFAINMIATSVIKLLARLVNTESLPKSSSDITFLLHLLNLGLGAWKMIDSQIFREALQEGDLSGKFLPLLMSLMVDSALNTLSPRLPEGERTMQPDNVEIQEVFVETIAANPVAFSLAWYLLLNVVKQKDRYLFFRIIPWYVVPCREKQVENIKLHSLVASLSLWQDEFSHVDFCELVFDRFLLSLGPQENVIRHLLRLLWYVYPKMDSQKVIQILTATQPASEHSEILHDLHATLVDRIASANLTNPGSSSSDQTASISPLSTSSQSPLEFIQPASL